MTVLNQAVLQERINYRIKCRKTNWYDGLSIGLPFRLLQTTYSHIIGVCKQFSCNQSWHMLFWLLKGVWLTCNRCPFSVLPTPFWSPIKHLFWTAWQPIDWLLVTSLILTRFFHIYRWFVWNYVMFFQNPICIPSILKWRGFVSEDGDRIAGWQSWLCFCLLNHFGSSVKAMWKASTHLTEEPISPCSFLPPLWKDGASEKWSACMEMSALVCEYP